MGHSEKIFFGLEFHEIKNVARHCLNFEVMKTQTNAFQPCSPFVIAFIKQRLSDCEIGINRKSAAN